MTETVLPGSRGHGDARRQRQRRAVGHECDLLLETLTAQVERGDP